MSLSRRSFGLAGTLLLGGGLLAAATASNAQAAGCQLKSAGGQIKHVVYITFDNVHLRRDNPNVPSDLELMPNLLNFILDNGTISGNHHTPLISHTADDIVTALTGVYGDRQGIPVSNSYGAYQANGTVRNQSAFTYWTTVGADGLPNMLAETGKNAPAPWVPFTRAGCDVGAFSVANLEFESIPSDVSAFFGATSTQVQAINGILANNANDNTFAHQQARQSINSDWLGIAVHCAAGSPLCSGPNAAPDALPDEPGGYTGYQALFGHKYIAPPLGGGTPNVTHDGYQVTNAAGNLVDLNGNQINGAFLTNYPGFPGYSNINASQALAYAADMLESGVQVTNIYMADLHGNEFISSLDGPGGPCYHAPDALGSGSACYLAQAAYYNQAFGTFFQRLAKDGITPKNTMFVVSSDEGDHEAGANVGRAIQPTPANCNGGTVSGGTVIPGIECTYPAGSFGELDGNLTGLLTAAGNTTPFGLEADTAPEFYLDGNPGPDTPVVRTFEHDVANLTAANPYTGTTQKIDNYLADPTEEAILHFVNADPARTPTLAMFAKPDYYLSTGPATCSGSCVTQNTGFAWDHGDYAAEINTNYVAFAGPGVRHLGLDGPAADQGTTSSGPDSGQIEVYQDHFGGPWADETDIRPTLMYLTGLRDDYEHDGRVITQILSRPNQALSDPAVTGLGECYKQLNSSVGDFAAYTLQADTNAINSTSPNDEVYAHTDQALRALEVVRDRLAEQVKGELEAAASDDQPVRQAAAQTLACQLVIAGAQKLASAPS